jgi:hypothetical protein
MRRLVSLGICLVLSPAVCVLAVSAHGPIWAKNAANVQTSCNPRSPICIPSPDRKTIIEVDCRAANQDGDRGIFLRISGPGGRAEEVDLPEGAEELLWALNSKQFLINGSESAYSGFFVRTYDLRAERLLGRDISKTAQRDMVVTFPPCRAANRTEDVCRRIERDPQFNMSALAWTRGGAAVIVMAEVPCSSAYGGILCQVEGYELEVSTGRVLRRMAARELKKEWQSAMAWEMRIPEPPAYGPPLAGN